MPLKIITQDILELETDALVIPANKNPAVGNGLDRKVFIEAGFDNIMKLRKKIGTLNIGQAVATPAYALKSKCIIHTVTPMWIDGTHKETDKLSECYINSLKCALKQNAKSVAFPLLASGARRFPIEIAKKTAVDTINRYLKNLDYPLQVYLVINPNLEHDLFIKYCNIFIKSVEELKQAESYCKNYINNLENKKNQFQNYNSDINNEKNDTSLTRQKFLNYLYECDIKDSELAKTICCNKSTISKIMSGVTKNPSKTTVIALALAMELSEKDRIAFINCAGHSYPCEERDYKIEQLIKDGYKNFKEIDDILYEENPEWLLTKVIRDDSYARSYKKEKSMEK